MIRTIVLRLAASLVVTLGFKPGPAAPGGDIFRGDQLPQSPVIFK